MYRTLVAAALVSFLVPPVPAPPAAQRPAGRLKGTPIALPVSFEPNRGQAAGDVAFIGRGGGTRLNILRDGLAVRMAARGFDRDLEMTLVGSRGKQVPEGFQPQSGRSHYLLGAASSTHVRDVPHYGRVVTRRAYAGIDVVYRGGPHGLEYDFVVAPGADPGRIGLRFLGQTAMEIDAAGDLVLRVERGEIRHQRPTVYQLPDRSSVDGRFVLDRDGTVRFALGSWDRRRTLVIDPTIVSSTYLGGSGADTARAVAVDTAGNIYVGGTTASTNFPVAGAFRGSISGSTDAFVTKLNRAGTAIVYSTYLGGTFSNDDVRGIAVDETGAAYLTGIASFGFPATFSSGLTSATTCNGSAYVAKLAPSGNALTFAFCIIGTFEGNGIAVDSSHNVYVTGEVSGFSLTTVNAAQPTGSGFEAFVGKLNASASAWTYLTLLGGASSIEDGVGIAVDSTGAACVTGQTFSTDFPLKSPRQSTLGGSIDSFVTKYNASGQVVFSTYLGGTGSETPSGAAMDAAGNCYVTGSTFSADFPVSNAAQSTAKGLQEAYVTAYNSAGSAYLYSTYLGGVLTDTAQGIAAASDGIVHVVGQTASGEFPLANGVQSTINDIGYVLSSGDAGASLTRKSLYPASVNALLVDPSNLQTVYAGTSTGLQKSTDGGATWTRIDKLTLSNILALALDPTAPCTFYAGVDTALSSGNSNAIMPVSTDCGANWLFFTGGPSGRAGRSVTVTAGSPPRAYVSFSANGVSDGVGRITSTGSETRFGFGSGRYILAADPANGCSVYAGDASGQVYKNSSCTAWDWTAVGSSFGSGVQSLAVHPTNQATLLAGTSGGVLYRRADAAGAWAAVATLNGSVNSVVYAPGNPQTMYAAGGGTIYRSTDGGQSWSAVSAAGLDISALVVGATDNNRLYAGTASNTDAFYTRISASGTILASTWLGGHGADAARAVAVDADGSVVIVGTTNATDLPLSTGAVATSNSGGGDSFVLRLSAALPGPSLPVLTLDRTVLSFGGVSSGTSLTNQTPAQTIRLGQSGTGAVTWTATSNKPWLTVSPASGTGPATLTVAVKFDSTLTAGSTTAAITLTPSGASNTPGPINVTMNVASSTAAPSAPFGSFDTPVGDGTVLAGSVAVTGWTLDNVGVKQVELWRDLQPGETTPPFGGGASDPRTGRVFIANATFTDGARPDVEALYPTTPANYRAGWGYLMLTWGLFGQGNGTYKLYAFGVDQEGNTATIGTKTIIVSNNTATKPFGSIDTPAIGGDPGTAPNFGWGLTPKVNGAATCTIPSNGVQVSIDSGPLQPVVYGDARTDIAGAFPGFSNTAAAGGHFIFDWSTLANGAHTIGWLITDDCNRADGVGSRFFNVTTGTSLVATPDASFRLKAEATEFGGQDFRLKAEATEFGSVASAFRRKDAEILLTRGHGELPEIVTVEDGVARTIDVNQGERIELRFPHGYDTAYQLGPLAQPRSLPIGSTWDAASGIFYWQPAPGFLGRYRLIVANGRQQISVRVAVGPATSR